MKKISKQTAFFATLLLSSFFVHAEEKSFFIPGKDKITRDVNLVEERDFDANGRLSSLKQASGPVITYKYDKKGRISSVSHDSGYKETFEYNKKGLLTHKKTSADIEEWYDYDANGVLLAKRGNDSTGRKYSYDQNGKLVEITYYEGDVILYSENYEYNTEGRRSKKTYSYGEEELYTYDENKHLTKKTYADGTYTEYVYSKEGSLVYSHTAIEDTDEETFYIYELTEDGKTKKMKKYQCVTSK